MESPKSFFIISAFQLEDLFCNFQVKLQYGCAGKLAVDSQTAFTVLKSLKMKRIIKRGTAGHA